MFRGSGDQVFDRYEEDEWAERVEMFADPGGNSALRRASASNPRNLPCPTCCGPDRLTPKDVQLGYQCDECANAAEQGIDHPDYCDDGDGRIEEYEQEHDASNMTEDESWGTYGKGND